MKPFQATKLKVAKETVKALTSSNLDRAVGGRNSASCLVDFAQPRRKI